MDFKLNSAMAKTNGGDKFIVLNMALGEKIFNCVLEESCFDTHKKAVEALEPAIKELLYRCYGGEFE